MVAEVCLGSGAVTAREVSRFARNSRDWRQLIEMCGGRTRRVNLPIRFDNSRISLAFSKPLLRLACYLFCEIGTPSGAVWQNAFSPGRKTYADTRRKQRRLGCVV